MQFIHSLLTCWCYYSTMKTYTKLNENGVPYAKCLEYERLGLIIDKKEEDSLLGIVNTVRRIKLSA